MKNILLFMPYGSVGGMEKLAHTFYKHYKSLGYNVKAVKIVKLENDIVNFGNDEFSFSSKDFAAYSKLGRVKLYCSIPRKLREIITKNHIDYTISFGDMANCFSALSKTTEIKIASIHALKSVELSAFSVMNKLFELSYKTIYRRFNKVVCISEAIKKDLVKILKYKFDNLSVIYNPHDFVFIRNKAKEDLESEFERNIFAQEVILFLGRLSVQKAPWHLINAFAMSQRKDINLVFVGDGSETILDLLREQVKKLEIQDRVFFLGRKENPYKYLKKAEIVALTSYYEGTPNVIAEAIALNTPVISSNCTEGISEMMSIHLARYYENLIITEAGIITPTFFTGKLVVPSSFDFIDAEIQFATGINYFFNNHNMFEKTLRNSSEILEKKFDLRAVGDAYLKQLKNPALIS